MDHRKVFRLLTLFLCCLIKKKSQAVRWNSERDSCSDLHGVYTNDFTVLMTGEIVRSDQVF